jgi:hypothetical protein
MYILLVAVDMQLKATAILIPRDATEEGSATLENQNKSQNCVQRRKKQDHASLLALRLESSCQYGCIFMIHGFYRVSNFKFYVEWVGMRERCVTLLLPPTIIYLKYFKGRGCGTFLALDKSYLQASCFFFLAPRTAC